MSLTGYVVRRLLQAVPVALGVTILVFFLIHLVPGDPARTILGNQATPPRVALLRHDWGLDHPLPVQYEKFMGRLAHGDLGSVALLRSRRGSARRGAAAGHALADRLRRAVLGADRRTARRDRRDPPRPRCATTPIRVVPLVGLGFPPFWIGIMLLLVFGLHLGPPVPGRRLRRRFPRPPALDVPAGADRRARASRRS